MIRFVVIPQYEITSWQSELCWNQTNRSSILINISTHHNTLHHVEFDKFWWKSACRHLDTLGLRLVCTQPNLRLVPTSKGIRTFDWRLSEKKMRKTVINETSNGLYMLVWCKGTIQTAPSVNTFRERKIQKAYKERTWSKHKDMVEIKNLPYFPSFLPSEDLFLLLYSFTCVKWFIKPLQAKPS